jgi:molecular chaperone GrpE
MIETGAAMNKWPETDALLDRFRDWLDQVREESRMAATNLPEPQMNGAKDGTEDGAASGLGLMDMVREFTALRHEVKLQTKSSRGLEEHTAAAVAALEEASRQFRSVAPQEAEAARRAALPLIESLADLDEALERAQAVLVPAGGRLGGPANLGQAGRAAFRQQLADLYAAQPAWKRWLCRSWYVGARDLWQADADDRKRIVDALAEGYAMVRKRLHRAMAKEGLYRMASLGLPVDPHAMTVIEVVDAEDHHAPGTVVEEIRPGYRWNGKVVRFAEVRAARAANQASCAANQAARAANQNP